MLTNLTAAAVYAPDDTIQRIHEEAEKVDFETRPLAAALGVSYCTLIRVLKRLGLHQTIRDEWKNRRQEKRTRGKNA